MDKYVVVYSVPACASSTNTYLRNEVYYVTGIDALALWLQDNPEIIVECIAKVLK